MRDTDIDILTPSESHAPILLAAWRARRDGESCRALERRLGVNKGFVANVLVRYGLSFHELEDWPEEEFLPAPVVPRPCIVRDCEETVMSAGPQHRMCPRCAAGIPTEGRRTGRLCKGVRA